MEIGFNDDVVHREMTFHIQTEDHGEKDSRVSTQLFLSGRILDSKTVSYAHLLVGIEDDEERRAKIRKVMVAAHRNYYRRLLGGDYDQKAGLEPEEDVPDERKTVQLNAVDLFEPTVVRVPEVATSAPDGFELAATQIPNVTDQVAEDPKTDDSGEFRSGVKVTEEDGKVTFTFDDGAMMDLHALSRELNKVDVMPADTGVVDDHFRGLGFDDDDGELMDLGDDFEIEVATPVVMGPPPPLVPEFPPTGHLAFQGLLEPEPAVDVVEMVASFLQSQSKT